MMGKKLRLRLGECVIDGIVPRKRRPHYGFKAGARRFCRHVYWKRARSFFKREISAQMAV
ncbi:MAG: hypothetical protein WA210_09115 [Burkholderiaceae bacterium]